MRAIQRRALQPLGDQPRRMFFLTGYRGRNMPGSLMRAVERSRWIARIMFLGNLTVVMAFITRPGFYLGRFLVAPLRRASSCVIVYYLIGSGPRMRQGRGVFLRCQSSFLCHWLAPRRLAARDLLARF